MKPIKKSELDRLAICNSKRLEKPIAIDGIRYQWVGIGFVNEGPVTGNETPVVDDSRKEDNR